jgi:hypothetical protein
LEVVGWRGTFSALDVALSVLGQVKQQFGSIALGKPLQAFQFLMHCKPKSCGVTTWVTNILSEAVTKHWAAGARKSVGFAR